MRPGQNKRIRGRSSNNNNNRRGPNPLTRSFESNGPDVKVRGTAQHIAEKYTQLARDTHVAGDPVGAENYLQHAEHYFRIIASAHQSQQALLNGTRDEADDNDDEEFDTTNDRFTFRTPQAIQQAQQGGQPFAGERAPGDFEEGEQPGGDGVEGVPERPVYTRQPERMQEGRPYEPRQQNSRPPRRDDRNNRPDRNFRPRSEDRPRPDDQERFVTDRGFDRTPREGEAERAPNFRPRRPPQEIEGQGEQPGLPAFLTAPLRVPIVQDGAANDTPAQIAGMDAGTPGLFEGEDARGPFRARRRRRVRMARPGGEDGGFETEPTGGGEE